MNVAHQAMFNSFLNPDPHAAGVFNMLNELYPAFANKVFKGSGFIGWLVRSGFDATDIMEYPICGRCESLAALDGYAKKGGKIVNRCSCMKCGHSTIDPVSFREWMVDELKHKAPPDIAEVAEEAVDLIAYKMMQMAENQLKQTMGMVKPQNMGILMPDGSTHNIDKVNIEMTTHGLSNSEFKQTLEG